VIGKHKKREEGVFQTLNTPSFLFTNVHLLLKIRKVLADKLTDTQRFAACDIFYRRVSTGK
jgi:hypothetical protein